MQIKIDGKPATAAELIQLLRWPDRRYRQSIEINADSREIESIIKTGCFALQHRGVLPQFDGRRDNEQSSNHEPYECAYAEFPVDEDFPADGCEIHSIYYIAYDKPEQFLMLRAPEYCKTCTDAIIEAGKNA